MKAHLQTLELNTNKTITQADVKSAWKTMAKRHHPDKGGDAQKMSQINAAWDALKNLTTEELNNPDLQSKTAANKKKERKEEKRDEKKTKEKNKKKESRSKLKPSVNHGLKPSKKSIPFLTNFIWLHAKNSKPFPSIFKF